MHCFMNRHIGVADKKSLFVALMDCIKQVKANMSIFQPLSTDLLFALKPNILLICGITTTDRSIEYLILAHACGGNNQLALLLNDHP